MNAAPEGSTQPIASSVSISTNTESVKRNIAEALNSIACAIGCLAMSVKPSRFREIADLTTIAARLQGMLAERVDDIDPDFDELPPAEVYPRRRRYAGDVADMNREILMMAQQFMGQYMEMLKPKSEERGEVTITRGSSASEENYELQQMLDLRQRLREDQEEVPAAVEKRIKQLFDRIEERTHDASDPASDPVVLADDVRGRLLGGGGAGDGSGVGGSLAERRAGDEGPLQEVQGDGSRLRLDPAGIDLDEG